MAVTQRRKTLVNGRRKLSPAQIKAGFGGKRRKAAARTKPRHKPAARKNTARKAKPAAAPKHRRRSATKRRRTQPNLGKVISFSLPKESTAVAKTKRNTSKKRTSSYRRTPKRTKVNGHRRRSTKRNHSMGDIGGLVSSAVFTIAGAVGTKYITQMVLTTSNTGVMGYFGNLVSAFLLSWGVKAFMKNEKAAAAVLSGGIVQVVLRLIADYTPFGQYTANLGMGDYLAQNFTTPQRIAYKTHSAQLMPPTTNGMAGCSLYASKSGLYAA